MMMMMRIVMMMMMVIMTTVSQGKAENSSNLMRNVVMKVGLPLKKLKKNKRKGWFADEKKY